MTRRSWIFLAMSFLALPALGMSAVALDPTGFPYWRGGAYSDLVINHWPNAQLIRASLQSWRQIPLWNPMILSGTPFAADPLAGMWYPPHWLAVVLPASLGFNLLFWLHLAFAGWGFFLLMREEGVSIEGSLLGSLILGAMPKLVGHMGLGHLTLVEAVCWTPWLLLGVRRAMAHGLERRTALARFALAGALAGVTFLIDPRWLIPAAMLAAAYAAKLAAHSQDRAQALGQFLRGILPMAGFAIALAAPLGLPLTELVQRSTRLAMGATETMAFSLAPERLIGFVLPALGGWPEAQTYFSLAAVLLIVSGIVIESRGSRFWLGVFVMALLLAFGKYTPVYGWLSSVIPGMGLLRVPARFLLVSLFSAAALAGHALDSILAADSPAAKIRRARLASFAVAAVAIALAVVVAWPRTSQGQPGLLQRLSSAEACLAALLALAWIWWSTRPGRSTTAAAGILALVALDLAWFNAFTLYVRPAQSVLSEQSGVAAKLASPPGTGRIFSPSYSLPQQTAAIEQLQLADGVDPMQLSAYRSFMATATGFSPSDYSVTLPPFPEGDPRIDWGPRIDAARLGLLNVERIVAAYPLEGAGLELVDEEAGTWIYRNGMARPRAWVQDGPSEESAWRPAQVTMWSPDRIEVDAEGPGRLVLAEVGYPGWRATLDGGEVKLLTTADLLRSVDLPAGHHKIVFGFYPTSVFAGAVLGLIGLLGLAFLWRRT